MGLGSSLKKGFKKLKGHVKKGLGKDLYKGLKFTFQPVGGGSAMNVAWNDPIGRSLMVGAAGVVTGGIGSAAAAGLGTAASTAAGAAAGALGSSVAGVAGDTLNGDSAFDNFGADAMSGAMSGAMTGFNTGRAAAQSMKAGVGAGPPVDPGGSMADLMKDPMGAGQLNTGGVQAALPDASGASVADLMKDPMSAGSVREAATSGLKTAMPEGFGSLPEGGGLFSKAKALVEENPMLASMGAQAIGGGIEAVGAARQADKDRKALAEQAEQQRVAELLSQLLGHQRDLNMGLFEQAQRPFNANFRR
ncbi:MAG: hypothetical protein EVA65_15635 [Oceanococcus sp.]|nr:MAG: hypothetical protein EVA65_15635 [Oceanococcus sp.]